MAPMILRYLEDKKNFKITRKILYIFNTIFFIFGAIVFALGIHILFQDSSSKFLSFLDLHEYETGVRILLSTSVLVVFSSLMGSCAVLLRSRKTIYLYQILTVITFILLLSGSAFTLTHGLAQSKMYGKVEEQMIELINRYQWENSARRRVDKIQEKMGCCGGSGSSNYQDIHLPIPDTCRDQITGNQYGDECALIYSQYFETKSGWICGISLCICLFQIMAMILSLYICKYMRKMEQSLHKNAAMNGPRRSI